MSQNAKKAIIPAGVGKEYLRIGELAKLTGTTARTLRYYEELGLVSPALRTEGGFRLYFKDTVDTVGLIKSLSEAGFSLKEVSKMLDLWVSSATGKERHQFLTLVLTKRLNGIRYKINALKDVERKIELFLKHLETCRICPEVPAENVCSICGRVGEKPLEPLLSVSWKTKRNNGNNLSNSRTRKGV